MKELLQYLYNHGKLSRSQAKEVLLGITEEKYDPIQVASFLTFQHCQLWLWLVQELKLLSMEIILFLPFVDLAMSYSI